MPGIRDAAVVVAPRADHSTHLVAFYTGPHPLPADALRDRLGPSLPHYMVPPTFHWQKTLPLTPNSKIDRKTLTALAEQLNGSDVTEQDYHAPSTPTEQRLTAAWATVLGISPDQISRHDHFFDRGGTSLSAVKLAITLDRAVSLTDLTHHPILADLAGLVDARSQRRSGLVQSLSEPAGAQAGSN